MITQLTNILTLTFFIISLFSYGSLSSAIASQEDVNVILSMGITQDGEDIHQLVENHQKTLLP